MGTLGDLTGFIQTLLLLIVVGAIIAAAVWLKGYFKTGEEELEEDLSEEDYERYEESNIFTQGSVLVDNMLGLGIRESGRDIAQADYERYTDIDPWLGESYSQKSGLGRFVISSGDAVSKLFSSKGIVDAGWNTGELLKKYNLWK